MEKSGSHFQFITIGLAIWLSLPITLSLLMSVAAGGGGGGGGGKRVKYSIYAVVQVLGVITDSQLSWYLIDLLSITWKKS